MKRILASILTTILIIVMTLAAMFVLVGATLKVSPLQRAAAIGAEIVLGMVLLLGTVWLATHLAVRIFRIEEAQSTGEPRA
jgi:hypothetical protein